MIRIQETLGDFQGRTDLPIDGDIPDLHRAIRLDHPTAVFPELKSNVPAGIAKSPLSPSIFRATLDIGARGELAVVVGQFQFSPPSLLPCFKMIALLTTASGWPISIVLLAQRELARRLPMGAYLHVEHRTS